MNKCATALSLILFLASACGPAGGQPVYSSSSLPEATSIPMPAKTPVAAAKTSARITSFDVSPVGQAFTSLPRASAARPAYIAIGTTRSLLLYALPTLSYVRMLNSAEHVTSVAWSPDGTRLAVGSSKGYGTPFFVGGDSSNSWKAHLTVWDTSTWKIVFEPAFGNEMVNQMFRDLAWSPDGRLLAYSLDIGGVQVIDMHTGQTVSLQTDFASTVTGISWSPDSSRLVATGDMAYGIRRWRVSDDQSVRLFDPRASASMAIAWSPDGKRIASGQAGGTVCLWTTVTNKCDGLIRAHRSATFSLAWSPDGKQLATGGGVIRIWDPDTGKLVRAFGEDTGIEYDQIEWLAPDGPIVSLGISFEDMRDTAVRFWDVQTGSIVTEFRGGPPWP